MLKMRKAVRSLRIGTNGEFRQTNGDRAGSKGRSALSTVQTEESNSVSVLGSDTRISRVKVEA